MGKHRLDDFEPRDIGGCIYVQKNRGVAEQLLDAEVEHRSIAAMKLHGTSLSIRDSPGFEPKRQQPLRLIQRTLDGFTRRQNSGG